MERNLLALILFLSCLSFLSAPAQIQVTLGDASINSSDVPFFQGVFGDEDEFTKTAFIVRASELQEFGLVAGEIQAVSVNMTEVNGALFEDFSLRCALSTGDLGQDFPDDGTLVFGPVDISPEFGWYQILFDTPFDWDGTSDLTFQTCYENMVDDAGANSMWFTFVDGGASVYQESENFFSSDCDAVQADIFTIARPWLQLTWELPPVPPVADFSFDQLSPCLGTVQFNDLSQGPPSEYLWYLGDGSTSTDENPIYTYEEGIYSVSLVVSNELGMDSISLTDLIVIDSLITQPVDPVCTPMTLDNSIGFGATSIELNGQAVDSEDGSAGYESFTCSPFSIQLGQNYDLTIGVNGPADQAVAAWIDYNADGTFSATELIFSGTISPGETLAQNFSPALDAFTDSLLRMRVVADFALLGQPSPCDDMDGGQAEDHSIIIASNTVAPVADFEVEPSLSCDGTITFEDQSTGVPTSWFWQFGDGEFSTEQNPTHTYENSGTYDVSLTAQNGFGQDIAILTGAVTITLENALIPACPVSTTEYCCGYGLISVDFNGLNNQTENGVVGYEDFTCGLVTTVTEGDVIPFSAETGEQNPQDLSVFVDLNNDGGFTSDERLLFSANATSHSDNITIPEDLPVYDTRLRMRIIADFVGSDNDGCSDTQFGQAEDYSIIILQDTTPPTADIVIADILSCDGMVQFFGDGSLETDSVIWYFGDGNTSEEFNPLHTYTDEGVYDISLLALNAFGLDSLHLEAAVTVDFDAICDTLAMPANGVDSANSCIGFLTDDGGANGSYSSNSNGQFTIIAPQGSFISLAFSEFAFQNGQDFLRIYDGPDTDAPLIGSYTGVSLPGGGIVSSTGNTVTLEQSTNFLANFNGFFLQWGCQPVGLEEIDRRRIAVYPNPSSGQLNVDWPIASSGQWEVLDISGRQVLHGPRITNERLNLIGLPNGQYQFRYLTEDKLYTAPFILYR